MPEAEHDPADHAAEVTDASPEPDPPRRPALRWVAGLAVALVVVAGLTTVLVLRNGEASSSGPRGRSNPTSVAAGNAGNASDSSRTGVSPAGGITSSPAITKPSSPASKIDLTSGPGGWLGPAIPTSVGPDSIVAHLSDRWQLRFDPPNHRNDGGTEQLGRAGDPTEKKRHILANVGVDSKHQLRSLHCDGGGSDVRLATDADMRRFVEDCLTLAVPASDSAPLTAWLNQHYANGEHEGPSVLTYQSAGFSVTLQEDASYIETAVNGR
jgi:hypothetical protein